MAGAGKAALTIGGPPGVVGLLGARQALPKRQAVSPAVRPAFLAAAAGALLLSLGAPWGTRSEVRMTVGPPTVPVVKTVTRHDGTVESSAYTSDWFSTALVPDWSQMMLFSLLPTLTSRSVAGTAHPARVPIVVAAVLGFLSARRQSRRLLAAGLAVAAAGLVLTSAGSLLSPGWLLLGLAAALAAVGGGWLPSTSGRWADRTRTGTLDLRSAKE